MSMENKAPQTEAVNNAPQAEAEVPAVDVGPCKYVTYVESEKAYMCTLTQCSKPCGKVSFGSDDSKGAKRTITTPHYRECVNFKKAN
ncbi:MAG: hypothetical protein E7486_06620 [Ruminococcaceae bacterium]|nr:hypothetical protein [Oscillospiraceae bacterium]